MNSNVPENSVHLSSKLTSSNIVEDYFQSGRTDSHFVSPRSSVDPATMELIRKDSSVLNPVIVPANEREAISKQLHRYCSDLRAGIHKNKQYLEGPQKKSAKLKESLRTDTQLLSDYMLLRKLEVLKQHARVQLSIIKNESDVYRKTIAHLKDKLILAKFILKQIKSSDVHRVNLVTEAFFEVPADILKHYKHQMAAEREDLKAWLAETQQIYIQVSKETEKEEKVKRNVRIMKILECADDFYKNPKIERYAPCRPCEHDFNAILLDTRHKEGQVIRKWFSILQRKDPNAIPPGVITSFIGKFTSGFRTFYAVPKHLWSLASILIQRTIYGRLRRLCITPHGHWQPIPNPKFDNKDSAFVSQVEWMSRLSMTQLGVESQFRMFGELLRKDALIMQRITEMRSAGTDSEPAEYDAWLRAPSHGLDANSAGIRRSVSEGDLTKQADTSALPINLSHQRHSPPGPRGFRVISETAGLLSGPPSVRSTVAPASTRSSSPRGSGTSLGDIESLSLLSSSVASESPEIVPVEREPEPPPPPARPPVDLSPLPKPYQEAIDVLEGLNELIVPRDMLECLVHCAHVIYRTANEYEKINLRKSQRETMGATFSWQDMVTSPKNTSGTIGADFFFPIFLYITVQSRLPGLHRSLYMLQHFSSRDELMTETGYYLSCLESAVHHIVRASPDTYISDCVEQETEIVEPICPTPNEGSDETKFDVTLISDATSSPKTIDAIPSSEDSKIAEQTRNLRVSISTTLGNKYGHRPSSLTPSYSSPDLLKSVRQTPYIAVSPKLKPGSDLDDPSDTSSSSGMALKTSPNDNVIQS
eukprot:955613_1